MDDNGTYHGLDAGSIFKVQIKVNEVLYNNAYPLAYMRWAKYLTTHGCNCRLSWNLAHFVALFDPLQIYQKIFIQMPDAIITVNLDFHHTFLWEAIKVECLLWLSPVLVTEPNHTGLLSTPLLSPLIIWLAEMLTNCHATFQF